jgi:hypothetical protein
MSKLHVLSFVTITFGLLSCLALAGGEAETGLEGIITISPSHGGPAIIGVPNSKPYANAEFIVKKGDDVVASFKTDEQGQFRLRLTPGHYEVSMKESGRKFGRRGPFEVDIVAGQVKRVEWTCDSGMR